MKTPEEIKKGLTTCSLPSNTTINRCFMCPYSKTPNCSENMNADALAYIQQLKKQLEEKQISYEVMCDVSSDYYHEIRELDAAAPKWTSVENRLPHEHETVIVCADDGCVYAAQYWGHEMWRRELIGCARSDTDVTPTHWMEMPDPPKED